MMCYSVLRRNKVEEAYIVYKLLGLRDCDKSADLPSCRLSDMDPWLSGKMLALEQNGASEKGMAFM